MKRAESLSWATMIIERRFPKLDPSPEYQRDAVWTLNQKQLLIDSIIRNMDVPKLYFRQLAKHDPFDYEIIDGQQRIRTVYEFRRGKFTLSKKYTPEFGGMYYDDLPEEVKDDFDVYQLDITVIDEATDDEIRDMFFRLQNGKPLNAAEKRNAIGGNMRDFIADLVDIHPVFDAFQQRDLRFSYQQIAAQCVLLELTGSITDVKSSALDKMYQNYRDFNPDGAEAKRVRRVLHYLARAFRQDTPEFKGRAQFISLYWLVSCTLDLYTMSGKEQLLRNFFIDFESRRQELDDSDIEFIRYSEALSRTSDGRERIQYRHDMLLREWLLYAIDLETKDAQRSFTREQRIALYRRDEGICQICKKSVEFDDSEADHVIPHSRGGKTMMENGQITHKHCNATKGGR